MPYVEEDGIPIAQLHSEGGFLRASSVRPMATGWDGKMDFEREWNVDAAADRQRAPEPEQAALAARVKGHPIQPGSLRTVTPGPDGTVVLPAGTDINHIEVDGRNLVVMLPDGTQMVILDGAVVVPRIVVGDVEIPSVNLAALLIGEEPQPAAGPARSSGGNFLAADGEVGDPHGLGDLLPPTELSFNQPQEREILPIAPNEAPEVTIVTPNQPAGAINATADVSEAGLPARGEEPAGTAAASDSERTSGTIQITANDGLAGVTVNGTAITTVGQTVTTPLGVLTITSIAPDAIGYSYVLSDNVIGTPPAEVFTVVVTDKDGDQATATLTISIADDAPVAHNDTDLVAAGTYGPETGNVVTGAGTTSGAAGADVSGADGFAANGPVVGVAAGANGAALDNANTVGHAIQGLYGVLTLNGDGSYTYVRSEGTPGGVSDNFTYTVRDGDGDLSPATLTINIGDSGAVITSIPTSGAGTVVDEAGLGIENRPGESPGSDAPATIETTNGTITYVAPDMPATVTINGVTVTAVGQQIAGTSGTLTVTGIAPGSIDYSYTVTDNTSGDDVTDKFTVVVTDVDGDASAPGTLVITIKDDVPTAHDDAVTQTAENAPVVINAFTNDVFGADGVDIHNSTTPKVTIVSGPALGSVSYDAVTGLFTFTPAAGQEGTASFVYQIEDGDGDKSQATVTVTLLPDSTPTILIAEGSDTLVDEAALNPNGSNASSTAETATGALLITTGNDTIGTLFVNNIDVTNGGTIKGAFGTLTITGSPAAGYAYSYTLETNTTGNGTHDDFAITVTDSDGDPAATTLTIAIVDDKPQALPDTDAVAAGSFAAETGNVITGAGTTSGAAGADILGADGAGAHVSFGGSIVGGVFVQGSGHGVPSGASAVIHGQYGDLTLFSNGDYSYTRFTDTPGGVEDKFVYVLADGDGSTSPATLTISIGDSLPTLTVPAAGGETTTVYEAGLPARPGESEGSGEQAAPGPNGDPREAVSGTVNFHSGDGIQSLTVGGVALDPSLFPQTVVDNATGTLVITGGSFDDVTGDGSFTYTYTLKDNTSGNANTSVGFDIVLTDHDGDPASSTLTIAIIDDKPHALADTDTVAAGSFAAEAGNVITGLGTTSGAAGTDILGADSVGARVNFGGSIVGGVFVQASGQGVPPGASAVIHGQYGDLTLFSNGDYTYTRFTETPGGVEDKFLYVLADGDGSTSPTTLTISIADSTPTLTVPAAGGETTTVYEAGLPARPGESEGSGEQAAPGPNGDPREAVSGTVNFHSGDGIQSLTVGGVALDPSLFPQTVVDNGTGTLVITGGSYNELTGDGSFTYTYTLKDNTSGDGTSVSFDIVLTDHDGDPASSSLTIAIVDDVPHAIDDVGGIVTEDGAVNTLSGNVLTNDVQGADSPSSFVGWGADTAAIAELNTYGTLTQNSDGTWSYVLDNSRAATQALGASFSKDFTLNYTIQDTDGDLSSAKLVITVHGSADDATITTAAPTGPDNTVYEAGLPTGSLHDGSHVTTGTFTVTATDGIANIVVGGTTFTLSEMQAFGTTNGVVNTGEGTLRLTGYNAATGAVSYSYTLTATIDNDSYAGATPTAFDDTVLLTVNSIGGATGSDELVVRIVDDTPHAVDDAGGIVTEDGAGSLSGNVLTNDVAGADQPTSFVSWGADTAAIAELNTYGTLTQNNNGTWTYVLDNSRPATQALGASFSKDFTLNYTMQDADGDPSSAKLVITVKGAADSATVTTAAATGPDSTVYEAGLPTGSLHDGSHVTTGTFTVTATDGISNIVVGGSMFTLSQMQAFGTTNGVVNTGEGTLRLTGYNAATGAVSYSYTLTATIDNDSYAGATPTNFDDSVALAVNGIGGTTATDNLVVRIVDDVPHAVDDAGGTVTEDGAGSLSGNVLTNDVAGADQPTSFVSWGADTAAIAELNTYGTLTQNNNGTWTYVLDNSRPATQALGASFSKDFTLNYTMQDADGDPSSAKLVITVKGAADSASVVTLSLNGVDATVYEAGLPTGSLHDGSHVTTGTFTVTATDGISNIVVGGSMFTLSQMQAFGTTNGVVNTGEGTLRLTGYNAATGAVSYSYTLTATIDNDSYAGATPTNFDDSVALAVNGIGGTTATDNLVVRIVDDVPHAVDDAGGTVTEDGAGSLSGNVLTNDVAGADQPTSFVSWGADTAAIAELNTYGTLTQNNNGTWTYVLDNSRPATQALGASFSKDFTLNYTMQDADGDPSSAKLVITVKGAADSATVTTAAATGPDSTVYEAGLPSGSLHDGSHVTTGTFTVTATDGISNIVVGGSIFTLSQMQAFGTTNGVVNTGEGTLRLTGYNAATGAVSYSYTLTATIDNDSYAGATPTNFDDSVALAVNGIGGTTATDNLVVRIVDDTPTLGTVQNQQTDNNVATAPAVGTLHYVPGADGTGSMVITANTSSITVGGQAVATSQSGNVLTGYVDADHSGGFNAGDTTVFTLTVNPNAGTSGQYVFDLVTKLDPTVTDVPIGQGSAFGSGPSNEIVVTDKATSQQLVYVTGWAPTGGFTPAEIATWEATGAVTATQTSNVNGSTQGWGLANNNFDAGEFLRFDFGTLADYDGAGGPYTPPNTYNIVNASYATFSFFNFTAGEQIIFVAHYTDGTLGVFQINGPDADNQQKISAPAGALIDWIDVYQSSGDMKLNLTNVGVASSSIDKTIPFTLQFTDNDGDTTATQNFSVHVKDGLTPATPAAPIAMDLDGDGLEFVSLAAGVSHDYGAGAVNTAWVSADDGLLVHTVGSTYDIVFSDDAPGAKSDLEGLRLAYDSNGDGVFDAKDAAFAEFGVWQDLNGNGHVDAGEVKTLTEAGIAAIDLTSDGKSYAAANGDVTVLGEASFVRTDGSKGTIGDAVFATAPKDSDIKATDSTTASGFNQALVAASLVAVAGAVETQDDKQPSPTSTETTPVAPAETASASTTTSEPATSDETKSLSEPSDDKSAHSTEQPVQQASHGSEEPAPEHAALADHGASSSPVPTDTAQADQPALGDHQALLAQSINLPTSFDGNAAAALAAAQASTNANPAAVEVVKEALGAHDALNIDTLLAALPGGEHAAAPVLLNPVAAEPVDLGHMAAAAAVFEAAIAAHEAMAVAHG